MGPNAHNTEWSLADDDFDTAMGPATTREIESGAGDVQLDDAGQPVEMHIGKSFEDTHGGKMESTRDRQLKPNKIYIGGLPEHTRPEDLRNCFGKIGNIVTIELKLGYGFVEFDSREAAEESVARYHEGYFMGNKIRVEPSHGRGRSFKRAEDPGACFKCGENGHWARECPRPNTQSRGGPAYDASSNDRDRGYSNRDYNQHQTRETHAYREEYSRHASSRDDRVYDTPPAVAPPQRDRRAATPPRDRRDNPPARREYDEFRMRSSPSAPPVSRYDRAGHHGSERGYPSSGTTTHRDPYDRYDRRAPYSEDRAVNYPSQAGRPRTPPGPPPAAREEYDKPSRSNYQAHETRRRAATPPPPYPGSSANGARSRRRSQSPPPRYDSRYGGPTQPEGDRYGAAREGARVRDYHRSNRAEDYSHRRT